MGHMNERRDSSKPLGLACRWQRKQIMQQASCVAALDTERRAAIFQTLVTPRHRPAAKDRTFQGTTFFPSVPP